VVRLTESGRLVNRLAANGPHTSAGAIFAGAAANETPAAALILCASGGAATVGALDARIGPVAQWSELAAHNRLVAGSSPAGPTNNIKCLYPNLEYRKKGKHKSGDDPGNNLQISSRGVSVTPPSNNGWAARLLTDRIPYLLRREARLRRAGQLLLSGLAVASSLRVSLALLYESGERRAVVRETSSQEAEETPHGRVGWSTKSSYKGSPLH
jgi:hypothetical protein